MEGVYSFLYNKLNINELSYDQQNSLVIDYNNMITKSTERVNQIIKRITNDLLNQNFSKKYQIKSKKEFDVINNYVKNSFLNLHLNNHELLLVNDSNLKTNRVNKLIETYEGSLRFKGEYEKVVVIYCCFEKII